MLRLRVGVLAIIQVDQLNPQAIVITGRTAFPFTHTGMPGSIKISHVLDNFAILANGIMRADFGIGVVKPIDDTL